MPKYYPNTTTTNYPFGMLMPGRTYSSEGYSWGFNGKEKDDEVSGGGRIQDYGLRMYSAVLCRFFTKDPLSSQYPELTPYQFASNTPIQGIDLDGGEVAYAQYGVRVSVPLLPNGLGVTSSYSYGIALDLHNNIGIYQQGTLGLQCGIGLTIGLSIGINRTVDEVKEMQGSGANIAGFVGFDKITPKPSVPFENSVELTLDPKKNNSDFFSGVNFGSKRAPGFTTAASVYIEGSGIDFFKIFNYGNTYKEFSEIIHNVLLEYEQKINENLSAFNLDLNDLGYDRSRVADAIWDFLQENSVIPENSEKGDSMTPEIILDWEEE
jgi:RHS repeat-associated protein